MAATKIRNEQLNVDSNLDVQSHNIINVTDPTTAQQAATKNYVDTQIANNVQGLSQKPTVDAITTGALAANTYANGSSGVGATLTANANGALAAQDGITLVANQLLAVNNEATHAHNGIYVVTQVGDASHPYILTRHVDMDDANEFLGTFFAVATGGTTYGGTLWLCAVTTSPFVVGTTAVNWNEITASSVSGANPTATIGTSAVNGTATTYMRSDAAPAFGNLTGDITSVGMTTSVAMSTILSGHRANRETPSGTINGSNTSFTLAHTPISGSEDIYLNGQLLDAGGADYSISSGTITMTVAPVTGDVLRAIYWY